MDEGVPVGLRSGTRLELDPCSVELGGPVWGGVPGFWFCVAGFLATHEAPASAPASSKHSEQRRENDDI